MKMIRILINVFDANYFESSFTSELNALQETAFRKKDLRFGSSLIFQRLFQNCTFGFGLMNIKET